MKKQPDNKLKSDKVKIIQITTGDSDDLIWGLGEDGKVYWWDYMDYTENGWKCYWKAAERHTSD